MKTENVISENLRQYRKDWKITQEQFAKMLNKERTAYTKIENSKSSIKLNDIELFSESTRLPISMLLSPENDLHRISTQEQHLKFGETIWEISHINKVGFNALNNLYFTYLCFLGEYEYSLVLAPLVKIEWEDLIEPMQVQYSSKDQYDAEMQKCIDESGGIPFGIVSSEEKYKNFKYVLNRAKLRELFKLMFMLGYYEKRFETMWQNYSMENQIVPFSFPNNQSHSDSVDSVWERFYQGDDDSEILVRLRE